MKFIKENIKLILMVAVGFFLIVIIKQGCTLSRQDEAINYINKKSKKNVKELLSAIDMETKKAELRIKQIEKEYRNLHNKYNSSGKIIAELELKNRKIKAKTSSTLKRISVSKKMAIENSANWEAKYRLSDEVVAKLREQIEGFKLTIDMKDEELKLKSKDNKRLKELVDVQGDRIVLLEKVKISRRSLFNLTGGYAVNSKGSGLGVCLGVDVLGFLRALRLLK